MPQLIFLIGIPGSGKSTYAQKYIELGYKVHSSDAIREELLTKYGKDVSIDSEEGQKVSRRAFQTMFRRCVEDLKAGHNVIYDACNTQKSSRKSTLRSFRKIFGKDIKICGVYFDVDLETCKERVKARNEMGGTVTNSNGQSKEVIRMVPEKVLDRMYDNLLVSPPNNKGFDEFEVIKEGKIEEIIK